MFFCKSRRNNSTHKELLITEKERCKNQRIWVILIHIKIEFGIPEHVKNTDTFITNPNFDRVFAEKEHEDTTFLCATTQQQMV